MKIDSSKILVIGGAGFIGSFVVSELLKTKVGKYLFTIILHEEKK